MGPLIDRIPPVRAFRELRRDFDRTVLVLAAGDLVANFGFALVFPFLTIYLVESLGATAAEAGLVTALYSVCSIVSGAAGGWLADRVGRRRVMIVSVGLSGIVIALMGRAGDLGQIAALTMVLGLVDPAFVPAARAAVADVVPEDRRPRAYGLLSVANAVGWIAGPAIGAGLASLGYDVLFLISGILVGAFAIIAWAWLPETLGRATPASGAPAVDDQGAVMEVPVVVGLEPPLVPGAERDAGAREPGPRATATDGSRLARLRARAFAAFLAIALVAQGCIFLWVSVLPIHAATDLGMTTGMWGILFSLNGILIVLFQLRISTAVERRPKAFVMAGGLLLYAAAMGIVAVAQDPAWAVAALAAAVTIITCGEMLFYPMEAAFVSDVSPVDRRGRYQGFLLGAAGVGTALGPPIGGWVLDAAPGAPLWIGTAAVFLACAGALVALGRATRGLPAVDAA
ncbi:MAG: MFS transporter [Chloroflexi bacterium]|nr:MFS transporter [Chloroflexota bacterium]